MPKRSHRKHKRRMSGGMWPFDSDSNTSSYGSSSNYGSSSSSSGSGSMFGNLFGSSSGSSSGSMFGNLFGTSKKSNEYGSSSGYGTSGTGYGGKTRRRRMKGGFKDNTPTTGLASHAAPFSGPTAQADNSVGGRTRKRGRKGRKSHRRH